MMPDNEQVFNSSFQFAIAIKCEAKPCGNFFSVNLASSRRPPALDLSNFLLAEKAET